MKQRQPPQVALEVEAAFSAYTCDTCFNYTFSILELYSIPVLASAISITVIGTLTEPTKLRALCVAQMRKVWEEQINTKGPSFKFWEL